MANKKFDAEKVEQGVRLIIEGIGDDPNRNGVIETPHRVSEMYKKILNGYDDEEDLMQHVKLFDEKTDGGMVVVKDVPFWSFCEHHMVLFSGKLHIAYIPDQDKVLGLSKLIRIARIFSKKLQVQERLTKDIANAISKNVPNKGVAVKLEMEHHCVSIRGVRSPGSKTVTTEMTGLFKEDANVRTDFLEALK